MLRVDTGHYYMITYLSIIETINWHTHFYNFKQQILCPFTPRLKQFKSRLLKHSLKWFHKSCFRIFVDYILAQMKA